MFEQSILGFHPGVWTVGFLLYWAVALLVVLVWTLYDLLVIGRNRYVESTRDLLVQEFSRFAWWRVITVTFGAALAAILVTAVSGGVLTVVSWYV